MARWRNLDISRYQKIQYWTYRDYREREPWDRSEVFRVTSSRWQDSEARETRKGYLRGGIGKSINAQISGADHPYCCLVFQATMCKAVQTKPDSGTIQPKMEWKEKEVLQISSYISLGPSTTLNQPPIPPQYLTQSCPGPRKPEKAYVTSRRTTATKDAEAGD